MSRARLIKRLSWYYPTEKFHTYVTFPGLMIYLIITQAFTDIIFLLYGLIVCIVILYQGQRYWKLKLHRLKGIEFDQAKHLAFFSTSKKANWRWFYLMPFVLLIQLYFQDWQLMSNSMLGWGVLANVFAILEHINYYHTQLMYDNPFDFKYIATNKRLKKASLAKDLDEGRI